MLMMFDKTVRTILKDTVIIYKRFDKYIIYEKDTKIINYLCEYKYLFKKLQIDKTYINFILKKLNDNTINHIIIDMINSNDVIYKKEYINNNYIKTFGKSKRYIKNRNKIDKLNIKLKELEVSKLENINNYLDSILC